MEGPPRLEVGPEMRRERLAQLVRAAAELGDVAHLRFSLRDFYFFVHPDAIQHILVANHRNYQKGPDHVYLKPVIGNGLITSDGAFHLRQRRMIQPAFHRTRITGYARTMTAYALDAVESWHDGQTLDLSRAMLQLTLRIVIRTLCGVDLDDRADPVAASMREALALFSGEARSLLPNTRRATRALDETLFALIHQRRGAPEETDDILSMLLDIGDGSAEAAMSDQQVRDEIMTLFYAGHDTTASSLSWTWYLLSQHPEVDAQLQAELEAVLGGRPPAVEDLPRLRYTAAVFAESLRLYPPVWSISRQTVAEDRVGGYVVPAGMPVMVSPYVTHRDARFFDDPERFDPDRFHPDHDVRKRLPRSAYAPFGSGVRQCMGEPLAWMEGTLLLATIAQRYRVHLLPGHEVVPQAAITLRPRDGVHVTLERRGVR